MSAPPAQNRRLPDEAPELASAGRVAQLEAADVDQCGPHEVQAAQPAGDRRQHQQQRTNHHGSRPRLIGTVVVVATRRLTACWAGTELTITAPDATWTPTPIST